MEGLATAVLFGVGHDRLLRSSDRAELIVESMLVNLVVERQQKLDESRVAQMANAIGKVFGG